MTSEKIMQAPTGVSIEQQIANGTTTAPGESPNWAEVQRIATQGSTQQPRQLQGSQPQQGEQQ